MNKLETGLWGLLSVVLLLLLLPGLALSESRCTRRPIYSQSECLAMPECLWCCERPVGDQCFDSTQPFTDLPCSAAAVVSNVNVTCGSLCSAPIGDCESCERRNWCYYCLTNTKCQSPYDDCPDGQVIQQCSMRDRSMWALLAFALPFLAVGALLLLSSCIFYVVLVVMDIREEHSQTENQENEHTPLLGEENPPEEDHQHQDVVNGSDNDNRNEDAVHPRAPDGEGEEASGGPDVEHVQNLSSPVAQLPASIAQREEEEAVEGECSHRSASLLGLDDDFLCSMCYDARATVTLLPCYHTCCCEQCCSKLRPTGESGLTCPFCRVKIVAMVCLRGLLKGSK